MSNALYWRDVPCYIDDDTLVLGCDGETYHMNNDAGEFFADLFDVTRIMTRGKVYLPENCENLFCGSNLEVFNGNLFEFANVKSMAYMFSDLS